MPLKPFVQLSIHETPQQLLQYQARLSSCNRCYLKYSCNFPITLSFTALDQSGSRTITLFITLSLSTVSFWILKIASVTNPLIMTFFAISSSFWSSVLSVTPLLFLFSCTLSPSLNISMIKADLFAVSRDSPSSSFFATCASTFSSIE